MNYPYYRRQGWCCSSAVIESACKQILGGRIKGSALECGGCEREDHVALRLRQWRGNVLYEQQHQDNVLKLERLMKVPIMKPALARAA